MVFLEISLRYFSVNFTEFLRTTCFTEYLRWPYKRRRNNHQKCYTKKAFLKISQNSHENTCTIKKETLAQVFSFEFCKIFKNTFFTEHLRTTASWDDLSQSYVTSPLALRCDTSVCNNSWWSLLMLFHARMMSFCEFLKIFNMNQTLIIIEN